MSSRAVAMGAAGYRDGSTGEPPTAEDAVAAATPAGSAQRWSPSRAACLTLAIGLVVTVALALTSLGLYDRNETRLLGLRARELSLVLSTACRRSDTAGLGRRARRRDRRQRPEVPCLHGALCRARVGSSPRSRCGRGHARPRRRRSWSGTPLRWRRVPAEARRCSPGPRRASS